MSREGRLMDDGLTRSVSQELRSCASSVRGVLPIRWYTNSEVSEGEAGSCRPG